MNMKRRAEHIYHQHISQAEKLRLLHELVFECHLEMEAQDENMHPEVKHDVAEGMRLAKDYIRELGVGS